MVVQKMDCVDVAGMVHRLPTSALTLSGLLRHSALIEDDWMPAEFLGLPDLQPRASAPHGDELDRATSNLQWILVHLIEQTPRHNAHADLIPEAMIVGVVGTRQQYGSTAWV